MHRGRLEMKIAILQAAQPETTNQNIISRLVNKTGITFNTFRPMLKFLIDEGMIVKLPAHYRGKGYHQPSRKSCYVITPAGQQALENVRQSRLME